MRISVYICVLLSIFNLKASAAGPIIVGNGAGEGEYSVVYVRSNLSGIFEECANISCQLSAEEKQTLQTLRSLASVAPPARFKTSVEMGQRIFELHGTQNAGEVWINQDLLWQDSLKTVPFDVGHGAELWTHIIATVGKLPAEAVGSLGIKLKESLANVTRRGSIGVGIASGPGFPNATVEYLLWSRKKDDSLVIRDPLLGSLELSASLAAAVHCPEPVVPRIYSPSWLPLGERGLSQRRLRGDSALRLTLQFGVKWSCRGKTYGSHGLSFVELVTSSTSLPVFDPSSLYTYIEQGSF
jgi:hypothetical protein